MTSRRVAIVGAAGYTGAELVALLAGRAGVELVGLFGSARRAGETRTIGEIHPRLRGVTDLGVRPFDAGSLRDTGADTVFLATPHAVSHDLTPGLLAQGLLTIDLSAAFRLPDPADYPRLYGFEHERPDLLDAAAYGLPELNRDAVALADLIAAPGCYPTASILVLAPLVRAGVLEPGATPIVDAVSGVSGAGREPSERAMFCEVSLAPYAVFAHRHTPEIAAHAGVPVVFTPHLAPFDRGILATVHARVAPGVDRARLAGLYEGAYAGEPFVRLVPEGDWPSVGGVQRTNFCDIGFALDESSGHLIVVSAIDNLLKGAAGQAVQCFNLRAGLPEAIGLPGGGAGAGVAT